MLEPLIFEREVQGDAAGTASYSSRHLAVRNTGTQSSVACHSTGAGILLEDLAVSVNWGSFLWASW